MIETLIDAATKIAKNFELNTFTGHSAGVIGSALLAENNKIYTGINMNLSCGIGFCAEASAISQMLKDRATKIEMIVAVTDKGKITPPCGRCRELIAQVNKDNANTQIIISKEKTKTLKELLPYNWMDSF